jgi:hypothetical protein
MVDEPAGLIAQTPQPPAPRAFEGGPYGMQSLLDRHLLAGLVNAPWVRTGDAESADDMKFFSALQELVAYVFEESVRVKKTSGFLFSGWHEISARSSQASCINAVVAPKLSH